VGEPARVAPAWNPVAANILAQRMAKAYLSIGAIYKDEARYLEEWIEFHRLVGVERFFLYDNNSSDDHRAVVARYVDDGTVVLHDWPLVPGQFAAYENCVQTHAQESRWIAFIDIDEFLFSPTLRPLPEVLPEYEKWPGVGVNRMTYGTSGHRTPPSGLMTESYLLRLEEPGEHSRPGDPGRDRRIKSIVDPRRVVRCMNPHIFLFDDTSPMVDENHEPIDGWITDSVLLKKLRINHYWTKSEAEVRAKFAKPRAHTGRPAGRHAPDIERHDLAGSIRDEAITVYLPALRQALHEREAFLDRPLHGSG
jgi:hypothetical protein